MKIEDIQPEKWYGISFGRIVLSGRVDAVDLVAKRVIVWIPELGYTTEPPSKLLSECMSPEQVAAMECRQREKRNERFMRLNAEIERIQAGATPRGWIPRREGVRHFQGSVFYEGDYGRL